MTPRIVGPRLPMFCVAGMVAFKGRFTGAWRNTMREALKSFAERFIREDLNESSILRLRLFDNHRDGYNQNVLTQPYMRIALIEDGMTLDDPRTTDYEYTTVKKGTESCLLADGWIRIDTDFTLPSLMDRYQRKKR